MRRPSAKTFRLVAITAASAAVAACGLSSNNNTNALLAGPTGQPITVGISLPLYGKDHAGGFAPDGQACKKGYELWASDVNSHGGLLGRPVKLIILNDAGDPPTDAKNYETLISKDHVNLTLAPFSSLLVSQGAAQVTQRHGYALPAGSAGAPAVFALHDRDLFSTNVPASKEMMPFAGWLIQQPGHPVTAAYAVVDDPFADPPVDTAHRFLSAHGVRTVYSNLPQSQHYSPSASVRALTADAKQIAQQHHPEMVFLGSIAVSTVQAFMKGFQEANWTPKYFIASSGPDQGTSFLNAVGDSSAVGAMVPNGWSGSFPNALSHVMVQDYIAKYGGTAADINADVAESYSAGQVAAAAVQATRSLNQQKIINYLHQATVQTVLGQVKFNGDGQNTSFGNQALIFQWQPSPGGAGAPQFVQVLPTGKTPIFWAG